MAFLLTLSAVVAGLASSVSAATSGDFNVLAFNVAGLPALFNGNEVPGDKATNAGTIGSLFTEYDYDVIHVQEDMFPTHAGNEGKTDLNHISTIMPISTPRMTTHIAQQLLAEQSSDLVSTLCHTLTGSTSRV